MLNANVSVLRDVLRPTERLRALAALTSLVASAACRERGVRPSPDPAARPLAPSRAAAESSSLRELSFHERRVRYLTARAFELEGLRRAEHASVDDVFGCVDDDDCVTSCHWGVLNRAFYEAKLTAGECWDGCQLSGPSRCEHRVCVSAWVDEGDAGGPNEFTRADIGRYCSPALLVGAETRVGKAR